MHTFRRPGSEVVFNYNPDMSGEVQITAPDPAGGRVRTVAVPGLDLLDFVAEAVRGEKISAIEQASTATILGLPERR